jgi:hypothetical protein
MRLGRVTGTYLHGALEDPHVLAVLTGAGHETPSPRAVEYAKLARWFETNADTARFEELYL